MNTMEWRGVMRELYEAGLSSGQIAYLLAAECNVFIRPQTVRWHLRKMGVAIRPWNIAQWRWGKAA